MSKNEFPWEAYAEPVGLALYGQPTDRKPNNLRWGSGGSLSLDIKKGTFFNHEAGKGHGVYEAIKSEGHNPIEWLLAQGFLSSSDRRELEKKGGGKKRTSASGNADYPDDYGGGGGGDRDYGDDGGGSRAPSSHDGSDRSEIIGADGQPLTTKKRVTYRYDYRDAGGRLLYQVQRYEWIGKQGERRKIFSQRRPSGRGGWIDNLHGIEHQLYRQDDIAAARKGKDTIYLCEGEKDVDRLASLDLIATTNSGGASTWHERHAEALRGHNVVVLIDNDDAGRKRVHRVCHDLKKTTYSLKVLDLAEFWADIGDKDDVSNWLDRGGGTPAQLRDIARRLPEWTPPPLPSKFGTVPFANLFDDPTPYKWLVKGLLPMGERVLIYGEPQSGKSFLALDLSTHIALGLNYAGRKTVQSGVFYCAFEGGKGFTIRAMVAAQHLGAMKDHDVPFAVATRQTDILGQDGKTVRELIDEMKMFAAGWSVPLRLVVFDTVSACTPGMNENDGAEIGRFLGFARDVIEAVGPECSIILVHHKPKGGDGPRGSTKLIGDLETAIDVKFEENGKKDDDGREVRIAKLVKQREGERGQEWHFVLRNRDVGKDQDGDAFGSCEVVYLNEAHVAKVRTEEPGAHLDKKTTGLLYKCLLELVSGEGQALAPDVHAERPLAITTMRLYDVVRSRDLDAESKTLDALRKKYRGWLMKLKAGGFIDHTDPQGAKTYVWPTKKRVAGVATREQIKDSIERGRSDLMSSEDEEDAATLL